MDVWIHIFLALTLVLGRIVSFTLRPLYLLGRSLRTHRKLGGPQKRSQRLGGKKMLNFTESEVCHIPKCRVDKGGGQMTILIRPVGAPYNECMMCCETVVIHVNIYFI
jgi:hypothetical protein